MSTALRPGARPRRVRARAFLARYVHEVQEDRLAGLAAETAFFAVLGLFPGLLVAASLLGVLETIVGADVAVRAEDAVVSAVDLVLTDAASGALESVRDLFARTRGGLLTAAVVGALVTVSGAFAVVINALNIAYDTTERRSYLRRRLLGLVMGLATTIVVALALAVLVVGPLLGRGEALAASVDGGRAFTSVWGALRVPLLAVGTAAWVATLFHYAPSRRTRWRDAVPGAVLTTVLWVLASGGFHLYLRVVADANPVLGAFGGGVIVMTWAYLLSLALLLGGELNATLAVRPPASSSRADAVDDDAEEPDDDEPDDDPDDEPVVGQELPGRTSA